VTQQDCPICGAAGLHPSFALPGLEVWHCSRCGHRVARHESSPSGAADYHQQYEQGAFLDSLRATRLRQATEIVGAIGRHSSHPGAVLDFGAGRGFFLEVCRREGLVPLAGADTSELAVGELRISGVEAHLLSEGTDTVSSLALALSFQPRVVTLLDVVEHLPPESLSQFLGSLLRELGGGLELLVIKVPLAEGLLYGIARVAAALGVSGPLRQLYQVGTWPPHLSYFSVRSMTTLLESGGLAIVERVDDLDFEPELLPARAFRTPSPTAPLLRLMGRALAATARAIGRFDSATFLCRPTRSEERQATGG
jgi:Methyltransferase domain